MEFSAVYRLASAFKIPIIVVIGIILYLLLEYFQIHVTAILIILSVVLLGMYDMVKETLIALSKKQFALDYIAILAIVVAIITQQYLVAGILALMLSTGTTLDDYGVSQAKRSLTQLIDRIPQKVILWQYDGPGETKNVKEVKVGEKIFIRKGEVVPLDGELDSQVAEIDESSLTGEPYFIEKSKGDVTRSGTVNIGQSIVIVVTKTAENSTYKKIVDMVKKAQQEKSPFVRLAHQYSTIFTIITLIIAGFAFWYSRFNLTSVLSVLAVATPCPLIIATPIALLGGVNASAKKKIIIKKIAALEALAKINIIVFDKTGTITLGKPRVTEISVHEKKYTQEEVLAIAEAIERNSLHPLAKAIVREARERKVQPVRAKQVTEEIGKGIAGIIDNAEFHLSKLEDGEGMAIELHRGNKPIALFRFEDELKKESREIVKRLKRLGLELHIFTGDKKEAAEKVIKQLGEDVIIKAELSPDEKQEGIKQLKKQGKLVAMVGDGINDAPALALADVGMAFTSQEQTAASEAADIVFLAGDFSMVLKSWDIARKTIRIAQQSILWGIGLSIAAMLFAAVGVIPPIVGAGLQEIIDVAVILNSLRASR